MSLALENRVISSTKKRCDGQITLVVGKVHSLGMCASSSLDRMSSASIKRPGDCRSPRRRPRGDGKYPVMTP